MQYTVKDYQLSKKIHSDFCDDTSFGPRFDKYCERKIKELTPPVKNRYKCIQRPPNTQGIISIGDIFSCVQLGDGYKFSELPFHFELLPTEPVKEPITMAEVLDRLGNDSHDTNKLLKLYTKIKEDHKL